LNQTGSRGNLNSRDMRLIVICGATATGKSGLAIALSQVLTVPTILLSADSRQIYREFDIGTAKPSRIEQQQIPHYLIDICEPTVTLTLADYQTQVQDILHQLPPGTVPLLVGGTGLYIKSIVRGLKIPRVAPQMELRSQLTALGQPQCHAMLQQVDPATKVHPNDRVRTLRALEVFYVTGKPISEQQGECPPDYPILQIGLDDENLECADQRIAKRTDQMMQLGFVQEVKQLAQKYGADLPLLNTLGYAEMMRHLTGEMGEEAAIAQIILHTRQFAKQQRTWFKADRTIEWFDAGAPDLLEQVRRRVQAFLG
jgi:tRNA dimethylallyltransferase